MRGNFVEYSESEIFAWHLGGTPPAQVGLFPSLQGERRPALDPSAHTQEGLVLSPHGLRWGLEIEMDKKYGPPR